MKPFLRTNLGLSNEPLFRDADYIVYVEGKPSADRDADALTRTPPDEMFWGEVFAAFAPTTKLRLKGLGNKLALMEVAQRVQQGQVDGCIVCMDADYDRQNGDLLEHPRILYTFGYSWENDVFSSEGIKEALRIVSTADVTDMALASDLNAALNRLCRVGNWVGRVDIRCQKAGRPLQDKKRLGELLKLHRGAPPEFCRSSIVRKVQVVKSTMRLPVMGRREYDFFREYHGKIILFCSFHILGWLSLKYGRVGSIGTDVFENILLRTFSERMRNSDGPQNLHYRDAVQAAL